MDELGIRGGTVAANACRNPAGRISARSPLSARRPSADIFGFRRIFGRGDTGGTIGAAIHGGCHAL